MSKVYVLPKFNRTLAKVIREEGWMISRNSKNVVTVTKPGYYNKAYTFHLDFDGKCVSVINLKTRCSGYKDVTIPVNTSVMKTLIKIEAALNRMLEAGLVTENKVEVADNV